MRLTGAGKWPRSWKPKRFDSFDREDFASWWARCGSDFSSLDRRVVEQWIFRHWTQSLYLGLPLSELTSHVQTISTEQLLETVGRDDAKDRGLDSEHFQHMNTAARHHEPALTMNQTAPGTCQSCSRGPVMASKSLAAVFLRLACGSSKVTCGCATYRHSDGVA